MVSIDDWLSIDWMQKLLTAFICCHEEFSSIMLNNKEQVSKLPLDQITSEFIERLVKILGICNASQDRVENIRMWQEHLEIASYAWVQIRDH